MQEFSLLQCPINRETTLIEASAGTGKTYSIATLIVRLIGEKGLNIDEILVVTFTKAATAELNHRIRARIGEALNILRPKAAGESQDEEIDTLLLELLEPILGDEEQHMRWQNNLEQALESFDSASIHTIHGFCQRVLSQHAFESGVEIGLEVTSDHDALIQELVDDYVSNLYHDISEDGYMALHNGCGLSRDALMGLARKVAFNGTLEIIPAVEPLSTDRWAEAMANIRTLWTREREGILAGIEELTSGAAEKKNVLAANAYKADYTARYTDLFENWLRQGIPDAGLKAESWFRYFTLEYMAKKAKKGLSDKVQGRMEAFTLLSELADLAYLAESMADGYRYQFAMYVREEFSRRAYAGGKQSYDELLYHVAKPLEEPGSSLQSAVAERYRAALIDEFQDTDEMQWNIFHRLFGGGEHYLYLIGDPKQAIYGFRGANINVYLKARDTADAQYTMRRNFRSDAAYVNAMNHLLDWNGIFGDESIRYVNVEAKKREVPRRVRFGDDLPAPALSVTLFDHTMLAPDPNRDTSKPVGRGDVVKTLPQVVASEIVALLERKPEIYNEKTGTWRNIHPGDLAVLVRSNKQATAIHEAIQAVDLPAVVARVGDVFQSEEAEVLSWWLAAIARPNSDLRAKRLVTSLLFQWTACDLETVDPMHWENWISLLSAWQKDFAAQGFMRTFRRLLDTVWGETPATERTISTRLLSQVGGERSLTNLYHLAELLHDAATNGRLGLEGLITWLEQQRAEEHKDNEALEMRLETDAQAVQISTMHKSKGLQYPFVWAPYLWDGNLIMPGETSMLVAPDLNCKEGTTRTLNIQLSKDSEPKVTQLALAKKERISESLRLLYVTLTRAELYCKVYWGNISRNPETNAMGSVLYGASPLPEDEDKARELREAPANRVETAGKFIKSKKSDFWPHLSQLAQTSGDTIVAEVAQRPTNRLAPAIEQETFDLHLASFTRSGIDHLWAQSSYSGLTRHKLAADPLELKVVDEDTVAADYDDGSIGTPMLESLGLPAAIHTDEDTPDVPLGAMRGGAQVGEFFHKVYELINFDLGKPERDNPETHAALMQVITKCLHSYALSEDLWSDDLTSAFLETLRTPLGGPLGTLRLCDIPMNHRLDELQFDFPVAGGHRFENARHTPPLSMAHITDSLSLRYSQDGDDDTMRKAYACRNADDFLGHRKIAGFMTGLIDVVFKAPTPEGEKWFVADYKSNRIDPYKARRYPDGHFGHEYMRYEMEHHHYYVQYHLYSLALHRYLRHRLPGYSYEKDFGGAYYLFIRGMTGADTPGAAQAESGGRVNGCFFDKPSEATINKLDELFSQDVVRKAVAS